MKKILVTILVTAMVASVAACGKNNNTTETEGSVATSESVETQNTETEATETEVTESEATETGAEEVEGTAGEILLAAFQEIMASNPETTTQEAADALIANEIIPFMGGTMPAEPGFLSGFSADITGFEEATVFMPMIGAIPFVGYVFDLAEDADVEAFMTTLTDNADMRWNICVEAEEMVVEAVGDKVFFLMCKKNLAEE